jgi:LysM repeat protein
MRFISAIFTLTVFSQVFGYESVNSSKSFTAKTMTQSDYVSTWASIAQEKQTSHKIPASITLAQGLLESGNGNSRLATEGNNHFGIKCSNWTGEKIYVDDDIKNECFRKYDDAKDSYEDHSLFLKKDRYKSLFELEISDYKGWAKGLKTAGYATHPQYAQKLIDLIEKLNLTEYDVIDPNVLAKQQMETAKKEVLNTSNAEKFDAAALSTEPHKVLKTSRDLNYIVVRKGDTFYKLSKEFEVNLNQLYRWNDFVDKKEFLVPGEVIYLEPKKNRSDKKNASMIVSKDISLAEISQKEGIRLTSLMEMNNVTNRNEIVPKGQKVLLR